MALVLKIPIGIMAGVIWWALKQQPTIEVEPEDDGDGFRRRRGNEPRQPAPRRGPGDVLPRPHGEGRRHAPLRGRERAGRESG